MESRLSYDAIRWAMSQPVSKASAKFVLVAMADCVNADGADMLCWPSIQYLADTTAQDRKTVVDSLRRLRESGFIADTGARKGATGQVPVYLLKTPKNGTVSPSVDGEKKPLAAESNRPENGNVPESGTVPDFPTNSPVFPHEQSRFSLLTDPKTVHGTSKEPVRNQEGTKKTRGFDASLIDLPDWIEAEDWAMWCRDRKTRGKGISEDAARLQIKSLDKYRAAGFTPREVIEHSIASSYTGLYPPKRATPTPTGKHSGFATKDYREGVEADGSFH